MRFKKAYDSIDWMYLINVMKRFGFGPDMVKLVSSLYNTEHDEAPPCAVVQINRHLSKAIYAAEGLKARMPIKLLFIFALY